MPKLLIITGEPSGDLHGANLIRELKEHIPNLKVFGIGGEKLKEEGVELIFHIKDIGIIGIFEIIPKLILIRKAMRIVYKKLIEETPDLCLLIDYPGFNLRVARLAKRRGVKVVYYILPQIWAWGRWRLSSIYKYVDTGISILPFEHKFYKKTKIKFVGHPLLDVTKSSQASQSKNIVALLPGSRAEEIKRILPVMLNCVKLLPNLEFILPVAQGVNKSWVEGIVEKAGLNPKVKVEDNNVHWVLKQSEIAIVASGTATLEACLFEVPMVIIYKVAPLSYVLGRLLVRSRWIGLPNLIAGKYIVPEFIQFNAKPEKIVRAVQQILKNREKMLSNIRGIKNKLGTPGAVQRAAQIICDVLNEA